MHPKENGHNPQNDIFVYTDMLAGDPRYAEGAAVLRDVTRALIENGDLPETILIQGEDCEIERVVDPVYRHPLFEHDRKERTLKHNGHTFPLTTIENELLLLLEDTPNVAVRHETINKKIWGYENYNGAELSKGHISRIKSKLPFYDNEERHAVVRTVIGVGYLFKDSSLKPEEKNKVVFNPKENSEDKIYMHRLFEFDPNLYVLKIDGVEVRLTNLERNIMEMLIQSMGGIVPKSDLVTLLSAVRNSDAMPNPEVLKTHISHLRGKIKAGREVDEEIIKFQGKGYRLLP